MPKHCFRNKEATNKPRIANILCTLILQVPAAASSLPQLREGKEAQLPSKAVRLILVGWAASTSSPTQTWALALPTGFGGFLPDSRGSTQGRKSLSGGTKHTQSEWQRRTLTEDFQHVDIIFSSRVCLAEGGGIQRCRARLTHLTAAAPSSSSREGPLYSHCCWDLYKQQLDAGSPPVYKVQWQRLLIQFSHWKSSWTVQVVASPHPPCTLTCLTFSTTLRERDFCCFKTETVTNIPFKPVLFLQCSSKK